MELTASGKAIAQARDDIIRSLSEERYRDSPPSPIQLVRTLSGTGNSVPYRVAVTSLIASGEIEATPTWKLRIPPA